MKHLLYAIVAIFMLSTWSACSEKAAPPTQATTSGELPSMATYDVSMLISDSGVSRSRASSKTWLDYDNDKLNKYQHFPNGVLLEQLDSLFNSAASIYADTAWNYETKQLWRLVKNVHIVNAANEHFYTQELYWNVRSGKVYSDSLIRIERPDVILEGIGFESDDRFTNYVIKKPTGTFPLRTNNTHQAPGPTSSQERK